jgi:translocation and assembly module TamB
MGNSKVGSIVIKILKVFGWIVFSIVALLILIAVSIQIPWVQNKIKQEAIAFLEKKIGTPVGLDHFSLSFPKEIVLEGLYFEDQKKDTLLYAGRIGIDTDLWNLTDNIIDLKNVELDHIVSQISRTAGDSAFNFDYIIKTFVTDTTTTPDTTSAGWDFKFGKLALSNLSFRLDDAFSGNHLNLKLADLSVKTEVFDLKNSEINLGDINLSGVRAIVTQTKLPATLPDTVEIVPEDSAAVALNIGFRKITLSDINADYDQTALRQVMKIILPSAQLEANNIDIKNQVVDLAGVRLQNGLISFQQMEVEPKDTVARVDPQTKVHNENVAEPWKFSLNSFDLAGTTLQYYDFNQLPAASGIDFSRLWISDLNTRLRNVFFDGEEGRVNIQSFTFREKSGFKLKAFHSAIAVLKDSLAVKNFLLHTTNSKISMEAAASFPSLQAVQQDINTANFYLNVISSTLSLKDLLFFSPDALDSLPLSLSNQGVVNMSGFIKGKVNDLDIERLQIHALDNTSLFANGRVQEVMNPDKLFLNLHIDRLYSTRADIKTLLTDSLIPPSIELPEWFSLAGNIKGTMKAPEVDAVLKSAFGSAEIKAVANLNENVKENYRGEIRVHEFLLGKLLKQPDQIGRLDMVAAVNGSGVTIEELDALIKVRVNRLDYSGYSYRDFRLDGSMKKYFFSGKALLRDENLNFILSADLDYNNEIPHYVLELDLKNADFKKLKLSAEPLKMRATLNVDLKTPDFKKLNGNVALHHFGVFNGQKLFVVDSLLFASIDQEGKSEIDIQSDILSGSFKGTINIFSLPDVLGRHFNRYFAMRDTTYEKPLDEQNFKFDLKIKNTELITEILVPELEPFVPGEISGEFNSIDNKLALTVGLAEINYSGVAFDSISFKALSDDESLDFTLSFDNILMDTLSIKMLRLAGNIMHDSIRTNLMILDSLGKEKYFLGGVFHSFEDAFQFSFLKNHVVLNYEKWDSPRYNTLQFTQHGLEPNNFYIERDEERILLLKKNTPDSTLSLAFQKVDLKSITSLVEGTTPVSGFIDGEVTLASSVAGSFETDLRIKQLGIFEKTWGDLAFLMKKKASGPTNFNMFLEGPQAQMKADGFFGTGQDSVMLIRGNIQRIDLAILEPLTFGQLKDLSGTLRGELSVQGKTSDPTISGRVNFNKASFLSTYANTTFNLPDETIYLRNDDMVFDRFTILDAKKNEAVIDGLISSTDHAWFDLKLNLTAKNFQLLNTTEEDNDLFYGKIGLSTKASITGTSTNPVVRMNISLAESSELTYVVPQSEKVVMDQKGIVVFIDKDAKNDVFLKNINPRDTITNTFTGIDLTANIELSDTEKFNIVIDPATGDRLEVQGNSTLTLHMDPNGDMQLSGRYEISSGSYALSFAKIVKRRFEIEKGSTITWAGDPLNAEMNLRAIYEVETSPADLVANQVTDAELPMYKKQVPFQVFLILKGELLFPEISFELDMPEKDRDEFGGNVYAMLMDINTRESDLNKQVFALLILKRFISDNPLESQGGGSLASSARQSVSKILSDQLNRLSSNVKGVQLSFDLKSYEDYSSGSASNQTELQLGVSKSLMNDRLVVKVSGNVNLEGEQTQQDSFTDFIGDLALEYKLTEDGRFRITGFRNNNFDMINGNLIETGAGLIYIKDYDSLLELFKANNKKN